MVIFPKVPPNSPGSPHPHSTQDKEHALSSSLTLVPDVALRAGHRGQYQIKRKCFIIKATMTEMLAMEP